MLRSEEKKDVVYAEEIPTQQELTFAAKHLMLMDCVEQEDLGGDTPFCFEGKSEGAVWATERGVAWTYVLKTFRSPRDRMPTKVKRGDICGFVIMLQQEHGRLEPEQVRLEAAMFYVSFLQTKETIADFFHRLKDARKTLVLWGRQVSDENYREAYLTGASYHATWKAGEDPRPTLRKTRFYNEVKAIDTEERLLTTKYSIEVLQARLERHETRSKLTLRQPQQRQANNSERRTDSGGAATGAEESKKAWRQTQLCKFDNNSEGCRRIAAISSTQSTHVKQSSKQGRTSRVPTPTVG